MFGYVLLTAALSLGQSPGFSSSSSGLDGPVPAASLPAGLPLPETSATGTPALGQARASLGPPVPLGTAASGAPGSTKDTAAQEVEKKADEAKEPKRRSLPSPWSSPPFPGSEYQGYPLVGVPIDPTRYPLMKFLQGTYPGDLLDSERIRLYGWVTVEGNVSNDKFSNSPTSYWIRPNKFDMDQTVVRLERQLDSVQTDHIDWGFRATFDYGIDYRYFTAGGWLSEQLLEHNRLYGFDPTELYLDVYVPWVAQGMIVRVGRWIACPDIETQFAPDNYMGSHSILFTYDTYTQTGMMTTFKLSDQWTLQAAVFAGTDMAPWYRGATWTGGFGTRFVTKDNNDAFYGWLNAINSSMFRRFDEDGQPAGHDNFNYYVGTWEHRFNTRIHTKTEAYFMWQRNAVVGGTPSIGPVRTFGGGGGIGTDIPGLSLTYGAVNYTMIQTSPKGFITIRNEYWRDEKGERSGFPGTYSSHTIGFTHNFTPLLQIRPEIGYYRNWTQPAFDLGTRRGAVIAGFDMTLRF
jgi:hypothetical protein